MNPALRYGSLQAVMKVMHYFESSIRVFLTSNESKEVRIENIM
jgi:hypothetical protein